MNSGFVAAIIVGSIFTIGGTMVIAIVANPNYLAGTEYASLIRTAFGLIGALMLLGPVIAPFALRRRT